MISVVDRRVEMEYGARVELLGTPLPEVKGRKDQSNFEPVWKQEVRDSRGRKRLHGAFTGGFSAGYFNTVGSKEGWAPASYTSSRDARASVVAMTQKDFMDEEDFHERDEERNIVPLHPTELDVPNNKDRQRDIMGETLLMCLGWEQIAGSTQSKIPNVLLNQSDGNKAGLGMIARTENTICPDKKLKWSRGRLGTVIVAETTCDEVIDADDEEPYQIRPVFLRDRKPSGYTSGTGRIQPYAINTPEVHDVRGFVLCNTVSHSIVMDFGLPVLPNDLKIGCPYDILGVKSFTNPVRRNLSEEVLSDVYLSSVEETTARDISSISDHFNTESLSTSAASYMSERFRSSFDQRPTLQASSGDSKANTRTPSRFLGRFIPSRLLCKRFGVEEPAIDTTALAENLGG